ncbi:hypothetical protein ANCDUO_03757 [Ancylostoma duodenale]|uniref:Uncharacterized protein n=1 Tax=Ancylostoma duodenale TaxID=51022 RepID=A0A0C2DT36_9BILA|nr:hypothetical protein ANCDUO_03757 [Ancylostoma duodenale]
MRSHLHQPNSTIARIYELFFVGSFINSTSTITVYLAYMVELASQEGGSPGGQEDHTGLDEDAHRDPTVRQNRIVPRNRTVHRDRNVRRSQRDQEESRKSPNIRTDRPVPAKAIAPDAPRAVPENKCMHAYCIDPAVPMVLFDDCNDCCRSVRYYRQLRHANE